MPNLPPGPRKQWTGQAPLPAILRPTIRFLLRTWSRFPKASGWQYQIVERWGSALAVKPLECRLFNGTRMRCDLRDHVQRQIYFRGAYEPIETYLVKHLLRPGMIVIDAGANVGQYTLITAVEVGRHGEVHAFEPVPNNFERLVAHVQENGLDSTVRMNMTALWHCSERVRLHRGPAETGDNHLYAIGVPPAAVDTLSAAALRLDDYVAEKGLRRVDFIKIDVEGAEWFAFQGAAALLSRWRPTMLVEVNRRACWALGYEPERIWEFLKPYGYLMWAVGQSPETCRSLSSLVGVDIANVIFHTDRLPDKVIRGWSYKSVLHFHRHHDEASGRDAS